MKRQTKPLTTELIKLRQLKGLSQRDLASQLQMRQSQISNIENGKSDPRLTSFLELARFLGTEVMLVPLPLVATVNALLNPDADGYTSQKARWAESEDDQNENDYEEDGSSKEI